MNDGRNSIGTQSVVRGAVMASQAITDHVEIQPVATVSQAGSTLVISVRGILVNANASPVNTVVRNSTMMNGKCVLTATARTVENLKRLLCRS